MPPPSSLPYRVSTITATGSFNEDYNAKTDEPFIDLDVFYNCLHIVDEGEGVIYAEYGKKNAETNFKGHCHKMTIKKRVAPPAKTKRFDNQVTLVYRAWEENYKNEMNIKVFKNGIVQMTGIRYIDQGSDTIDKIMDIIREAAKDHPTIVKNLAKLKNVNYRVQLINSDLQIGFQVKQEWLYQIFTTQYKNECTFEPCIYPGVKILYFCNPDHEVKDGVCRCEKYCGEMKSSSKKKQEVEAGTLHCRKITIAVFQSGKMIITGAQTYEQINEAHDFITKLLKHHQTGIEMKKLAPAPVEKKERVVVLINKKNIIYGSATVSEADTEA